MTEAYNMLAYCNVSFPLQAQQVRLNEKNYGFFLVHGPFCIVHVGLNNYQERYTP